MEKPTMGFEVNGKLLGMKTGGARNWNIHYLDLLGGLFGYEVNSTSHCCFTSSKKRDILGRRCKDLFKISKISNNKKNKNKNIFSLDGKIKIRLSHGHHKNYGVGLSHIRQQLGEDPGRRPEARRRRRSNGDGVGTRQVGGN